MNLSNLTKHNNSCWYKLTAVLMWSGLNFTARPILRTNVLSKYKQCFVVYGVKMLTYLIVTYIVLSNALYIISWVVWSIHMRCLWQVFYPAIACISKQTYMFCNYLPRIIANCIILYTLPILCRICIDNPIQSFVWCLILLSFQR